VAAGIDCEVQCRKTQQGLISLLSPQPLPRVPPTLGGRSPASPTCRGYATVLPWMGWQSLEQYIMTNPTVAVTAATSMASTTWRQGRWMYLRRERRSEVAPQGADRITRSLARHAALAIQTGWLSLLPSQTLPGCPVPRPRAKLPWGAGGRRPAAKQLRPASTSRPACLPCTEPGTAPTERLARSGCGDSAEPSPECHGP